VSRVAPLAVAGIRLLPVVHDRIEMTAVVRAALATIDPAGVAVELPASLRDSALRAIARLPRISLLVTREPGEDALVWVAAPGDPFVEALRWAVERDRPVFFVDPDLPYAERHVDPIPDPYSVLELGPERFFEMLGEKVGAGEGSEGDREREAGMAYHLRRARESLDDGGEILGLVGAAHVARLSKRLAEPVAHPFARRRKAAVELRHLHPSSLTALLPDAPLAHAVWERVRSGEAPSETADLDATLSRKISVMKFGLRVIAGEGGEAESARKERLADYAASRGTRPVFGDELFPDRHRLGRVVWEVAAGSYREQTDESVKPWQRRLFFDYASRCARVQGQLVPGLYEWAIAARGVGDDNLAWEVFDAARTYPWQEESAEIETASVDGDELDLGTRRIRFRRRFMRVKRRPVPVKQRPAPQNPEDWLEGFDSEGLCSYPPEDVVIEDYGRFLQRKAVSILSAELSRTEPFTTSMLDGLDIRETLRNAHEGRIYVEERGRVPGEAGSVVVIFDRDRKPEEQHFPFAMTWLGEHDQESDMAFYSTGPAEQVVGPGIMRATYGGFMLSAPRGRLFDVWSDRDYSFARDKAEVLEMSAIDYSVEKLVVHVAEDRPSQRIRRYAADHGKQLLHVPLGSLSPVTLKKIRVMHILAGKNKRAIAEGYVW
jgi:hypothetical protein